MATRTAGVIGCAPWAVPGWVLKASRAATAGWVGPLSPPQAGTPTATAAIIAVTPKWIRHLGRARIETVIVQFRERTTSAAAVVRMNGAVCTGGPRRDPVGCR